MLFRIIEGEVGSITGLRLQAHWTGDILSARKLSIAGVDKQGSKSITREEIMIIIRILICAT